MRLLSVFVAFTSLAVASGSIGCKSDDDPVGGGGTGGGGGSATLLEPPPEGQGIQLSMTTTVPASSDVQHCQFVRAPAEGLNINSDEIRFTTGSHHVLVYLTHYEDIPTKNDFGEPVDTSGVFDCSQGPTDGWSVDTLIAGSQNADKGSIVDFPPGVAMHVPGNAVLLMNAHYVNAQANEIQPEVLVNLWTIPDEEVVEEGAVLFWYDLFIRVDPKGTGRAAMSCPITHAIKLRNAQSHMHRRGVGYEATAIGPDLARDTFYQNDAWEGVPVERWEDGYDVAAGSRIEFHCDYQNPEDRVVWQGASASDEMCMLIASYWPADATTSNCSMDGMDPIATAFVDANWIGNGEASCGDTLGCVQAIGPDGDFFQGVTDCVLGSAPEESPFVSDAVRCMLMASDPSTECQAEFGACLNH